MSIVHAVLIAARVVVLTVLAQVVVATSGDTQRLKVSFGDIHREVRGKLLVTYTERSGVSMLVT